MEFTILGHKIREPMRRLETFPTPPNVTNVLLTTDEVTSLCPITGQPDFSRVTIEYVPGAKCLESKSLKLYLWTFREQGAFIEQMVSDILKDVVEALEPVACTVTAEMKPRAVRPRDWSLPK